MRVGAEIVTEATARVAAGASSRSTSGPGGPGPPELADGDDRLPRRPGLWSQQARRAEHGALRRDAEADTLEGRVRAWLERRGKTQRGARPALGVVHRLDKETSGLVVFTRTWLAKQSLASQFRKHTVHRRYLAIAHGDVRRAPSAACSSRTAATACAAPRRGSPPPRRARGHHPRRAARAARRRDAGRLPARDRAHPPDPHSPERGGPPHRGRARLHRGLPGRPCSRRRGSCSTPRSSASCTPSTEREMRWDAADARRHGRRAGAAPGS